MAMTLIATNSGSQTTSSFTSGIDSTYKLYIFKFININPDTDTQQLTFQANATDSSSYDEYITSTFFGADHSESDSFFRIRLCDSTRSSTRTSISTNHERNG